MIRLKPGTDLASLLASMLALSRMSAADLARASGYAEGQISKWRRGIVVPTAPVLIQLADAAGFDLALIPRES